MEEDRGAGYRACCAAASPGPSAGGDQRRSEGKLQDWADRSPGL